MPISELELLLRLAASVALGSLIGYERERREQPAGLRTHLLVTLASATFMLVSSQFAYYQNYAEDSIVRVDGSRIASNVVVGIGFLGGGAILHSGLRIKGLTTAASLWLAAAVGLASGSGMFRLAFLATAISLFTLVVLRYAEEHFKTAVRLSVRIDTEGEIVTRKELEQALQPTGAVLVDVDQEHNVTAKSTQWRLDVRIPTPDREESLLALLEGLPSVRRVRIRRIER
jgi:putative Mg2+ transporter-C (MgtC) family protein